jgi:nucleoside-triphosphatase THEP1
LPFQVGKYYFAMEAFERLVLPLLKPSKAIKLHVIDEVGRMELQSEHFKDALMALLASPNVAVRLFSFDLITMSSVNDVLADEYFGEQYVLM